MIAVPSSTLQREMMAALSARYAMNSHPTPCAVRTPVHLVIPSHDSVTVVAVSYVRIVTARWAHIPDDIPHLSPPLSDSVVWFDAAISIYGPAPKYFDHAYTMRLFLAGIALSLDVGF